MQVNTQPETTSNTSAYSSTVDNISSRAMTTANNHSITVTDAPVSIISEQFRSHYPDENRSFQEREEHDLLITSEHYSFSVVSSSDPSISNVLSRSNVAMTYAEIIEATTARSDTILTAGPSQQLVTALLSVTPTDTHDIPDNHDNRSSFSQLSAPVIGFHFPTVELVEMDNAELSYSDTEASSERSPASQNIPLLPLPSRGNYTPSPVPIFNAFASEVHKWCHKTHSEENAVSIEFICSCIQRVGEQVRAVLNSRVLADNEPFLLTETEIVLPETSLRAPWLNGINMPHVDISPTGVADALLPDPEIVEICNEFTTTFLNIAMNSKHQYDVDELNLVISHFPFLISIISQKDDISNFLKKLEDTNSISKEDSVKMFPGYDGTDCITQENDASERIVFLKNFPLARPYMLSTIEKIMRSNIPFNPYTREVINSTSFIHQGNFPKMQYIADYEFKYFDI